MNLAEYFRHTHPASTAYPTPAKLHGLFEPQFVAPRVRRALVLKVMVLLAIILAMVAPLKWSIILSGVANAYWLFFVKE